MLLNRTLVLCFVLGSTAAIAAEPRPLALDEALRLAEEASPSARAIALEVERARSEVRAAGLWPNPEVSLVREESAGTVERFANVSQSFPWSGRLGLEKASARSAVAGAEAAARQARVNLRARVRESFIDLVQAQERTAVLEAGRSRLGGLVEILRAREREGESSGFDRMRSERELAEVEVDLLETRGRLAGARAVLAALLGLSSEGLVASGSLAAGGTLPAPEEMRALASARGDVIALEAEAESAGFLARAGRRRAVPEPTITVGTKTTEAGSPDDRGAVVGVGFSLPLFDRGQGAAPARILGALLRARRAALAGLAAAEAEAAYAEVVARREAETAYSTPGDTEDLAQIARAAYEGGEMRILELLDAYRTALEVRLKTIDLHAAARKAEAALGRAVGSEVVR